MNYTYKEKKGKQKKKVSTIDYPIVTDEKKGKLIISSELEEQIDTFHAIAGATEWSGILLYVIKEGDISKPESLVIEVKGIFPMDIGTPGYTEYDYDERTLDMYDLYPDALTEEWRLGHIHTHHGMQAYFSGTDLQELRDNIDNHAYYLSLIVNFDKKYCAKLCIKGEREVKESSVLKYTGLFSSKKSNKKSNSTKIETIVYNADLDIEMPEKNEDISFIGEILKLKKKSYTSSWSKNNNYARYEKYAPKGLDGWGHVDNPAHNTHCPEGVAWGSPEHLNSNKTNGTQVSLWDDTRDKEKDMLNTSVNHIISFVTKLITVDTTFVKDKNEDFNTFLSHYNKKYLNMTQADKMMYKQYMAENIDKISEIGLDWKRSDIEVQDLLEDSVTFLDNLSFGTSNRKEKEALASLTSDIILDYLNLIYF